MLVFRMLSRMIESRATVWAACGVSLLLGLFFVFVWSPLPWGWKGIDFYYEIARALAHGAPFPTVHLVWGYAYFLAFWYRLFGDRQWVPLVVQVALNATIPLMLYHLVRAELGQRVAVAAALLAGLFSFNTVYASTQASDSVCTVLVVAAVLGLATGDRLQGWTWFALAGLLTGLAYQFRPNLALFPAFVAAAYLATRGLARARLVQAGALLGTFAVVAAPWVVRNYRWTGLFIPASTHGGVQLWFGTLQAGAYEQSWIYNPRASFETPPVDYTSVDEMPLVISATANACDPPQQVALVYWTSRDRARRRLAGTPDAAGRVEFVLPAQPAPTAVYYYFENRSRAGGTPQVGLTPPDGDAVPLMLVVSRDHLGDLDVDHDALDIFDVVRLLRHVEWREPIASTPDLDLDGDGALTEADARKALAVLVHDHASLASADDPVAGIGHDDRAIDVALRDGSAVSIPRSWSGRITDLDLRTIGVGSMAAQVVSRSRPFAALRRPPAAPVRPCLAVVDIGANRVPYRRLPHEMRRFEALALDNIRHDPAAFLTASAHRALRVFVIEGSDDTRTAYQFKGAAVIYALGRAASVASLALCLVGIAIAVRRRQRILMLLVPIVYVPATICFMLINARYSMTTQPFVFAFVAVTAVAALDRVRGPERADARPPAAPAAGR